MPRFEERKHRPPSFNGKCQYRIQEHMDEDIVAASFEKYNLPHSTIKQVCNCRFISLGLSLLLLTYKMRWLSVKISNLLNLEVPGPTIEREI